VAHPPGEVGAEALDPIGPAAAAGQAGRRDLDADVDQDRQVGARPPVAHPTSCSNAAGSSPCP